MADEQQVSSVPAAAVVPHAESPDPGEAAVIRSRRGPVGLLTLNRPAARNALSEASLIAIQQGLTAFTARREVRAIVIAANGPVFSTGHDLKELTSHRQAADGGGSAFARIMALCSATMQAIIKCPKPVIAAVEGVATAAGCQLVATCDLAVASTAARFATPGVNIGLFCSTPSVALTRNVSRKKAMEMLLLGEALTPEDALAHGLINRVVHAGKALAEALSMAEIIASKSPLTIAIGKEAFYGQIEAPLASAYAYASEVMVHNMLINDAEEGIRAFLDKRPPEWTGS